MVTYAYTTPQWRKVTKTAYEAQKRSWADVSWYKPISSTPKAPVQPTSTPVQAPINKDVTKPTVSPVGWLSDAMKATDTYKNLLAQGYTEEDISSKVSAYQEKRQKQEPSTTTSTEKPTQWQYQGLQWDVELKPIQWGDEWINLYKWFADYQDVSDKRLTEIASNVLSYYQTNPNAFSSYGDFKKFFSYNDRADQQKMVLDSFRKNKQYSDMFNGMSVEEISSAFSSWALSQEQITALSQLNPDLYMQVQSYMNTQNSYNNANSAVTGNPIQAYMQSIWIEMPETQDLMSKYKELVNTEEIQQYQTKANELQWQIEKIDEQIFSMRDTIEQQYAWTGMTRDVIDAITADRTEALNKQKRTLSIDYNTNINQYNSLYKAATDEFGIYEKQIALDRQQRQDAMQQLGFYYQYTPQWMSEYATNKFMADTPDLDTAMWEEQQRMALSQALAWYYKEFWNIIQRPQSRVVSDVINYAKQKWIQLSQALKENFVDQLKGKTEYKAIVSKDLWYWVTFWKISDTQYWFIDTLNKTITPYGWTASTSTSTSDSQSREWRQWIMQQIVDIAWGSWLWAVAQQIKSLFPDWTYWWWCGEFANDYALSSVWSKIFWDKLSQKPINSKTPQIWWFVVMDTWVTNEKWEKLWHVGIITWITSNWKLQITDSNRDWNKTTLTHDIDINDSMIKWYYNIDTNKISKTWNVVYDPKYADSYSQFLNTDVAKNRESIASSLWVTEQELRKQATARRADKNSQDLTPILDKIDTLLELNNKLSRTERWLALIWKFVNEDSQRWRDAWTFVNNNIWMKKFLELKSAWATFGALSEWERDAIYQAASPLNAWSTNEDMLEWLLKVKQKMIESWYWKLDKYLTLPWNTKSSTIKNNNSTFNYSSF